MTLTKPKPEELMRLMRRDCERIVWVLGGDSSLSPASSIRVSFCDEGPARPVAMREPGRTSLLGALLLLREAVRI